MGTWSLSPLGLLWPIQAFSWCHWATGCRGRAIMSFQCFTSPGPLFQDR